MSTDDVPQRDVPRFVLGQRCNWKNQPERLVYLGRKGAWHQFAKVDDPALVVWCEVLTEDLHMLESTDAAPAPTWRDAMRSLAGDEPAAPAPDARMGTHWETCATDGGPRHYACALSLIEQQARALADCRMFLQTERQQADIEFARAERAESALAARDAVIAAADAMAAAYYPDPFHHDAPPTVAAYNAARAQIGGET